MDETKNLFCSFTEKHTFRRLQNAQSPLDIQKCCAKRVGERFMASYGPFKHPLAENNDRKIWLTI